MQKTLFRTALFTIAAALLAACPSKSVKKPSVGDMPVVKGPDRPTGTPLAVGTTANPGGGAGYVVVKHEDLPHWTFQNFGKSLQSFKLGCEKLKARAGWEDVCAQAVFNQTVARQPGFALEFG